MSNNQKDTTMANDELRWDDPIENDGEGGFVLLEPGEYPFRVTGFERKRFGGSAKMSPCPQAALTIEVGDEATGVATVRHNLFLHRKSEWALCAFFRGIGARSHGERMVMDWGRVTGATGRCEIKTRTWKGTDGEERQSNEISKFLDPAESAGTPPAAADAAMPKPDDDNDIPF